MDQYNFEAIMEAKEKFHYCVGKWMEKILTYVSSLCPFLLIFQKDSKAVKKTKWFYMEYFKIL